MIRFLLVMSSVLLLGSMSAFLLFVSLLSIATVVWMLMALLVMFGLGVASAGAIVMHGRQKTRPIMTKSELNKFKEVLTARQVELIGLTRNREAVAIETSADALDQIQYMVERELALETLGRESTFLRETRAALSRIESGAFGLCLDCETEINSKRLAAVPWAAYCIECQERADLEGTTLETGPDRLLVEAA